MRQAGYPFARDRGFRFRVEGSMRRIRYSVAASLDGFIAGPNGESDWIMMDPEIDFAAIIGQFDTVLMGHKTFLASRGDSGGGGMPGMSTIVASTTLRPSDYPDVTMIGDELEHALTRLCDQPGKDIWLFGGGALFRSLVNVRLVDTVEVAVIPILLGSGIPLLPPGVPARLKLSGHRAYNKTGTVSLEYAVDYAGR